MTEEVSLDVIKKTQESLGKFIKKPPLTEKLLKKPPFRFLHDIVTNVIKETGFLKGLYNDIEMQSENIKDRDAKIAFLDKLINTLKIVTESKISARPSKIIAGLEPIKTNQLLQIIGLALQNNLDSTEAVSQVTGVKISPDKTKKLTRQKTEEKPKKEEKKLVRGQTQDRISVKKKPSPKTEKENRKNSGSLNNEPIKKTSKTRQDSKETESPKESKEKNRDENEVEPIEEKKEKKRSKEKIEEVKKPEVEDEEIKVTDQAEVKIYNESKKDRRSARRNKQNDEMTKEVEINIQPHYAETKADSIELIEKEPSKKHEKRTNEEKQKRNDEEKQKRNDEEKQRRTEEERHNTEEKEIKNPEVDTSETITKSVEISSKSVEKSTKPVDVPKPVELSSKPVEILSKPVELSSKPTAFKSNESEMTHIKKDIKRPLSTLRPPSVRPSSARPGAPRLKDRNDTILPPDQVVPLGKVKVIVESLNNNQDEEETVVMETPMDTTNTTWPATEIIPEDLPAQKGHLVSQILEQIGETPITTVAKPKIEWEQKFTDAGSEKLRQSIQTLTKAANPLGKLVNFLHEDVESMQAELKMWIDINDKLKTEIKVRKRKNEESMKPLQEQLARLEADIAKQNELISTTQANILRNQQKIKSLLTRD